MRSEAEREDYFNDLHGSCEECDRDVCSAKEDHYESEECPFMCRCPAAVKARDSWFCSQSCAQRNAERAEAGEDEPLTADIPLWCSSCERRFPSLAEMVETDHPCANGGE